MATRISQEQLNKFISPEAAMAPYQRAQEEKMRNLAGQQAMEQQKAQADAALAQLIKGKELDDAAKNNMLTRQLSEVEKLRAKYGPQAAVNVEGVSVNPETDSLGRQIANGIRQANITGYDIADPSRVIPTVKDAEEVKKSTGQLKALQTSGADALNKLNEAGDFDRFGAIKVPFTDKKIGTDKGIALDSALTDMELQIKELAQLGALSGPDMDLVKSAMGNITGIGSLIGGKERAVKQLQEVLSRAKSRVEGQATSRGYAPQKGYLEGPQVPMEAPKTTPIGSGLTPEQRQARIQQLRAKQGQR